MVSNCVTELFSALFSPGDPDVNRASPCIYGNDFCHSASTASLNARKSLYFEPDVCAVCKINYGMFVGQVSMMFEETR